MFFSFPDIDISLLTIKYHRFFLTHSVILPLILLLLSRTMKTHFMKNAHMLVMSAFTSGITLHLATDIVPRKPVNFLVVNTLIRGTYWDDRLWIMLHMLSGIVIVYRTFLSYRKENAF